MELSIAKLYGLLKGWFWREDLQEMFGKPI
jgi:hypothetical protein